MVPAPDNEDTARQKKAHGDCPRAQQPPPLWRKALAGALETDVARFVARVFPARFAPTVTGPERAVNEDLQQTWVAIEPNVPGLWLRVTPEGSRRTFKVKEQNGELYAVAGGILGSAIPVSRLPGVWMRLP